MKTLVLISGSIAWMALCSCRSTTVYVERPKPPTRTVYYTPQKVVGGSSTYSGDAPEDFRAVGPSN